MEAGAAGAAGTATAATAAAGGEGEGQAAEAQQNGNGLPEGLVDTLGQLQAGQEELRQFLQQSGQQEGEQTTGEEPDPLDLSFMDPADPDFDPAQVAERLGGLIDQAAERRADALMEQRVGPLESRMDDMARTADAERLVAEFPEMGDEKVATQVVSVARQIAEAHVSDPKEAAKLAEQPWFWRMTYMAARAAETANAEGDVTDPANLEGGSGSGAGGGSQVDMGDAIVGASRGGRSALPF